MNRLSLPLISSLVLCGCASEPSPRISPSQLFSSLKKDDFSALRESVTSKKSAADVQGMSPAARAQALQAAQMAQQSLTDAQTASLDKKFSEVMAGCNLVISGMSAKVEAQERNSFYLSMSGLIAGAVLAPAATAADAAANKAFIAAASGWSGATNLASQTLRTTGLAGDAVATARNSIVENLNKAINDAVKTEDCVQDANACYDRRFAAIQRAQSACIAYAITVPGAVPAIPSSQTPPKEAGTD